MVTQLVALLVRASGRGGRGRVHGEGVGGHGFDHGGHRRKRTRLEKSLLENTGPCSGSRSIAIVVVVVVWCIVYIIGATPHAMRRTSEKGKGVCFSRQEIKRDSILK